MPSRYNWMFQYYLRAEGLALSWVGSGRLIFSHNYSDADFEAVADRVVAAATAMNDDGWWWHRPDADRQGDQAPGAPGDPRGQHLAGVTGGQWASCTTTGSNSSPRRT